MRHRSRRGGSTFRIGIGHPFTYCIVAHFIFLSDLSNKTSWRVNNGTPILLLLPNGKRFLHIYNAKKFNVHLRSLRVHNDPIINAMGGDSDANFDVIRVFDKF